MAAQYKFAMDTHHSSGTKYNSQMKATPNMS